MKLVILDRDGVINEDSVNFIKTPNEWIPIQDSLESIALLNQSGFKVVIATNQSGISRGLFDVSTLNRIHEKMFKLLSQQGGQFLLTCLVLVCDIHNPLRPDEGRKR